MEALKMIGNMLIGSGIAAWFFLTWALILVKQGRLSIHIKPKEKED